MPRCRGIANRRSKRLAFLFGATVTDESFGVNLRALRERRLGREARHGRQPVQSVVMGVCLRHGRVHRQSRVGATAIASFALTSIFICLLCMQKITTTNLITVGVAVLGVLLCKLTGLPGLRSCSARWRACSPATPRDGHETG